MRMSEMPRKIRELRKRLRMGQTEFADQMGVSQGTVSKWETGEDSPRVENIAKLAELAGESVEMFWFQEEHEFKRTDWMEPTPVIGAVQAGQWLESVEWDEYDKFNVIVPFPRTWPDFPTVGFQVRGTSMNFLYPDNSIVIAIPTIASGIDPRPGDRVIVQRKDDRGLFEVTIKEYTRDSQGQVWLWPRSDDPAWKEPLRPQAHAESQDEILVTGIIVASFRIENPDRFSTSLTPASQ